MVKYQLQILFLLELQTLEVMFYLCGRFTVMIKAGVVKYQTSSKQQNQVVQQIIRRQLLCPLLVMVLCSLSLVKMFMVIMYMLASNELILYKLQI